MNELSEKELEMVSGGISRVGVLRKKRRLKKRGKQLLKRRRRGMGSAIGAMAMPMPMQTEAYDEDEFVEECEA